MAAINTLQPPVNLKIDFSPSPKQYEVWKALQPECPYCGGTIEQYQIGLDRNGHPTYGPKCSSCGETNIPQLILEGGSAGGGKAGLLDSEICTPFGFRKLKEMQVGSIITNPKTGGMQTIIALHPIETHNYYRVHFVDNTYFDCSEGHLWVCHESRKKLKRAKYNDISTDKVWVTKKMYEWYRNKEKGMYQGMNLIIPLSEPVRFTVGKHKPEIDPYILGALIGDGCMTDCLIQRNMVQFTNEDIEIVDRFIKLGYDMSHSQYISDNQKLKKYNIYDSKLVENLKKLGIAGNNSLNHFIPKYYKLASIEDRINLMQGLIDTDGYVDDRGHIVYTTISEELANDVAFVVRSLGGVATVTRSPAGYKKQSTGEYVQCHDAFDVQIRTKMNPDLCGISRKKSRAKYEYNGGVSELGKRITDIEFLGPKEGRCITVDDPSGLYVADNFTVTHNSYLGSAWLVSCCIRWPNMRMVVARLTLKSLRESTWNTITTIIKSWGLEENVNYKINNFLGEITFWNDSKIMMKELVDLPSDPDFQRLGSSEYSGAFVDEVGQISSKAIDVLRSRIRWNVEHTTKVPKLLMSTNPCLGWIRDRFVQDNDGNPIACADGERYIPFSVFDNPDEAFRKVYVANLDRIADKATRERLKYGNWDFVDTNVAAAYWNFDGEKHLFSGLRDQCYNPLQPAIISFDFNVAPFMSSMMAQIDYDHKIVYIFQEILGTPEEKCNNTPGLARKVRTEFINMKQVGGLLITGDPAGLARSTTTEDGVNNYTIIHKELDYPSLRPMEKLLRKQPPQATRLEFINALFSGYHGWQIKIDMRCRRFTEDLIYQKKNADGTKAKTKTTDPKTGMKVEKYGHLSDCFDYLICMFLGEEWKRFQSSATNQITTFNNGAPVYGSFDF